MKSSKKVLAMALALAMVVTAVPVTNAEAATTAKLSAKSVTVAAGSAQNQTKSIKVTTPSTWKSVKVKATSSKKSVATVATSGKTVKVTAVKKGTATVTVKVTAKKNKKAVSKSLKATVKVVNASLKFTTAPSQMVVDEEVTLATKACPTASVVTFTSSDPAVATVDASTGVVKAVAAGNVTITATTDYGATTTTEIAVKTLALTSVKQTEITQIELSYQGDASKVTKDDVVITRTSDNQRIYTKAVTNNATDKKLVVDTVLNMTDAKEFTVAIGTEVLTFTATDGKITSVSVDPTQIVYNTATEIDLVALAADDVVIQRIPYGDEEKLGSTYDFSISVTSDKGYIVGDSKKLVLNKIGDTAAVTIKKHTGTYENGLETGVLTFEGTITAIDKTTAQTTTDWTLASVNPYDWSKITVNHDLILGENSNLFINIKNDKGTVVYTGDPTGYNDYKVVSTNEDVIYVTGNELVPRKEGTAYVNIVDANGTIVYAYSITVKAAAKPVKFTVSTGSVTLSNATTVDDQATIELVAKDQYDRDYAGSYSYKIINTVAHGSSVKEDTPDAQATALLNTTTTPAGAKTTLTFNGSGVTKGSYSWKVEMKSGSSTVYTTVISATVQEPNYNATPTYALLLDGVNAAKTVDTTVTTSSLGAQTVNVKVGVYYNGVLGNYQTISDNKVTMTNPSGTVTTVTSAAVAGTRTAVTTTTTGSAFTFTARTVESFGTSDKYFKKAATGTYTISATFDVASGNGTALKTIKQNLVITDSQTALAVSKRDSVNNVSANSDKEAVLKAFEFNYNNVALSTSATNAYKGLISEANLNLTVSESKSNRTATTDNIYLENITVTVPVVLGDLNSDGTITDADVIYVDQSVTTGYFLAYNH